VDLGAPAKQVWRKGKRCALDKMVDVSGATFKREVIDNDRDVFLLVYAPFCPGSRAVMPLFERLAAELKSDKSVVIARLDKTTNDFSVPGIKLDHFPTVYLFPGKDKTNSTSCECYFDVTVCSLHSAHANLTFNMYLLQCLISMTITDRNPLTIGGRRIHTSKSPECAAF
jgi:thiol-disulfide isomerase/thioredoxin